jgi:hypothetical protein
MTGSALAPMPHTLSGAQKLGETSARPVSRATATDGSNSRWRSPPTRSSTPRRQTGSAARTLAAVSRNSSRSRKPHFNRRLRVREQETSASSAMAGRSGTLPADYLQWREVRWPGSVARSLEYADRTWLTETYPDSPSAAPRYFTIEGTTISVVPVHDTSQRCRMRRRAQGHALGAQESVARDCDAASCSISRSRRQPFRNDPHACAIAVADRIRAAQSRTPPAARRGVAG